MTTFTHASWSLLTALASVAYASHARAQSLEPVPVHREARVVFCVAPCEVTLPAGAGNDAFKFANEPASSWPGAIGTLTLPAGPSTVRIEYQDRSVLRKVAGLVGVSAMVGGFVYAAVEEVRDGVDVTVTRRNPALGAQLPRARQLALRGSF